MPHFARELGLDSGVFSFSFSAFCVVLPCQEPPEFLRRLDEERSEVEDDEGRGRLEAGRVRLRPNRGFSRHPAL